MGRPEWGRSAEEIDQACRDYPGKKDFSDYGIGANTVIPTPRADAAVTPVVEATVVQPEIVAETVPSVGSLAVEHSL